VCAHNIYKPLRYNLIRERNRDLAQAIVPIGPLPAARHKLVKDRYTSLIPRLGRGQ